MSKQGPSTTSIRSQSADISYDPDYSLVKPRFFFISIQFLQNKNLI